MIYQGPSPQYQIVRVLLRFTWGRAKRNARNHKNILDVTTPHSKTFDVHTFRLVDDAPTQGFVVKIRDCRKPTSVRCIEASRRPTATDPIVDAPNSHVLSSLKHQEEYHSNKTLSPCFHQSASCTRLQQEVLFFCTDFQRTPCCLCVNHPENKTIRSHFCQHFNVIQTFSVLFNVVK